MYEIGRCYKENWKSRDQERYYSLHLSYVEKFEIGEKTRAFIATFFTQSQEILLIQYKSVYLKEEFRLKII